MQGSRVDILDHRRLLLLPLLLAGGLAYFFFSDATGLMVPCVFHKITGLYCPGCGATRMIHAISRGDLASAFAYNKALFVSLPLLIYLAGWLGLRHFGVSFNKKNERANDYLAWFLVVCFVAFGVFRNLI